MPRMTKYDHQYGAISKTQKTMSSIILLQYFRNLPCRAIEQSSCLFPRVIKKFLGYSVTDIKPCARTKSTEKLSNVNDPKTFENDSNKDKYLSQGERRHHQDDCKFSSFAIGHQGKYKQSKNEPWCKQSLYVHSIGSFLTDQPNRISSCVVILHRAFLES